jgi:glycosyltransferase involved in cell wall biosynthesis
MLIDKEANHMRLLHIVGASRYGGVAKIILPLAEASLKQGWKVDILATDPLVQQAVLEHRLGLVNLDVIRREIRPLWDLTGLIRLCKFLNREQYQIVHTHTSKGGFIGRLAARLMDVPVIVHTAHGFAFHEGSAAPIRVVWSGLERLAARWCDRVVTVSEFHRNWGLELGICGPHNLVSIPNGIADINHSVDRVTEIRRQLGARHDDLLVLSPTRLASDKGLKYLIEAAALLPAGMRVRIAIAGEGPARQQLEQLSKRLDVTNIVLFTGFRRDVDDLLAACDVVVLPTLREGLSISLLEAMAAAKPIVTTTIGSQMEVASHTDMALLVPPANAKALSDAILHLSRDQKMMARLGANGRATYERFYTQSRMVDSYMQLYFDLLRTKCPVIAETDLQAKGGLQHGSQNALSLSYSGLISSPSQPKQTRL